MLMGRIYSWAIALDVADRHGKNSSNSCVSLVATAVRFQVQLSLFFYLPLQHTKVPESIGLYVLVATTMTMMIKTKDGQTDNLTIACGVTSDR